MHSIQATFHRVTHRTKTPYLARVSKFGNKSKDPMVILVHSVETPGRNGPPFARATIVYSPAKYPDYTPGKTMIVSNFPAIQRMQLAGISHSDS